MRTTTSQCLRVVSSCRAWSGPPGTSEATGRDQVLVALGGCSYPVKKLCPYEEVDSVQSIIDERGSFVFLEDTIALAINCEGQSLCVYCIVL